MASIYKSGVKTLEYAKEVAKAAKKTPGMVEGKPPKAAKKKSSKNKK